MERKWLYLHDGETHGPFTVKEIKALAREGKIWPTDTIWAEGSDSNTGVLAEVAVDFSQVPRLPEVSAGARATPTAKDERTLDPVLFVGPDGPKKRKRHRAAKKKAAKAETPPVSVVPAPPPLKLVVPQAPKKPEAPPPEEAAPVLEALPIPEAAPLPEAIPMPANVAAVHEEGISAPERYRRACAALSAWADRDENVSYVLAGDTEVICTLPEVLQILTAFRDEAFEVLEKLMEHLDMMVENRSNYYKALAQRGRGQ